MSERTQKSIKQDIDNLESQILDIRNVAKHRPDIAELEAKIRVLRDEYWKETSSQIDVWKSDIEALKRELKNKKEDKQIQFSERIRNWFRSYLSGVNFGYADPRIVWISEDQRFAIITSPGTIAGTGTAMGTGGYYYAKSEHWLTEIIDGTTYIGSGSTGRAPKWMEHEGRMTKDIKEKMIAFTEELRKR